MRIPDTLHVAIVVTLLIVAGFVLLNLRAQPIPEFRPGIHLDLCQQGLGNGQYREFPPGPDGRCHFSPQPLPKRIL